MTMQTRSASLAFAKAHACGAGARSMPAFCALPRIPTTTHKGGCLCVSRCTVNIRANVSANVSANVCVNVSASVCANVLANVCMNACVCT